MIRPKTADEIARMHTAGRMLARTLQRLRILATPGVSGLELDAAAEALIREMGGAPSFLGYQGYPATICISFNEEIVHGIPGARTLSEGDIVSLDVGAIWKDYQADAAITVAVGRVSDRAQALMAATEAALWAGIRASRPGKRVGDVSYAIEQMARGAGFEVVRAYGGHGIGRVMHERLRIPNWGVQGRGERLVPGATFALEPMLTTGGWDSRVLLNGWTVVTADGSLAAHSEHTIVVTENEAEVLTANSAEPVTA